MNSIMDCPACKSNKVKSYNICGLLKCFECQIVFDRAVKQGEKGNLDLTKEFFSEEEELDLWDKCFEKVNNQGTLRILNAFLDKKTLLEIGIGSGSFLNAARKKGFDVEGVELSSVRTKKVSQKYNILVHEGFIKDFKPADRRFDIIVMRHVLEHMVDPAAILSGLKRLLSPNGIVYICVPNVQSFEARLPGWSSYLPYHLFYYCPASLRKVVEKAHYRILYEITREPFSGWFISCLRTMLGLYGEKTNQREQIRIRSQRTWKMHLYKGIMLIFGILITPFRWIQARFGYGEELVVIIQSEE